MLGQDDEIGTSQIGKLADIIIVDENPLHNLKSLYGTGVPKLNEDTQLVERVGGVIWTVKDGIVYDARALLEDVKRSVREEKISLGLNPDIPLKVEN